MTRDEIALRMCPPGGLEAPEWVLDTIEAIVRDAVAAEREACAAVARQCAKLAGPGAVRSGIESVEQLILLRARGEAA